MTKCPRCLDRDVHKSLAKHFFEGLGWFLIGRQPVRCYNCTYRFSTWLFSSVKPRVYHYGQKHRAKSAA